MDLEGVNFQEIKVNGRLIGIPINCTLRHLPEEPGRSEQVFGSISRLKRVRV